jgi:hypothetical protein
MAEMGDCGEIGYWPLGGDQVGIRTSKLGIREDHGEILERKATCRRQEMTPKNRFRAESDRCSKTREANLASVVSLYEDFLMVTFYKDDTLPSLLRSLYSLGRNENEKLMCIL